MNLAQSGENPLKFLNTHPYRGYYKILVNPMLGSEQVTEK